jgi:putative PIN family toxin of toxin-antitoxin system
MRKVCNESVAMIPKRIVLDTNVCLDLFVFRDPRWASLLAALHAREVAAVTRTDCRTEWQIVLGYSHLPLDDTSRHRSAAEFDALIDCMEDASDASNRIALPRCRDPDDQKFLELARDAQADILITKDKALLKLARKIARAGLFFIMTPEHWVREHEQSTAGARPPQIA